MATSTACLCKLLSFMDDFILTDEQLHALYDQFLGEFNKALSKDQHDEADLKCDMTFIQDLPGGEEKGKILIVDWAGTSLRLSLCNLRAKSEPTINSKTFTLQEGIIIGTGEQLFDHIAKCIEESVKEFKVTKEGVPVVVKFAFPCRQTGLTNVTLEHWTHGYCASGVENEDIGRLLTEALDRRGCNLELAAIITESTETLLACATKNPDCKVAVIIDRGINVCYVEKTKNCELVPDEFKAKPYMLINMELGAFGDKGSLEAVRTEEDGTLDEQSSNMGSNLLEKMASGKSIANLVRLVVLKAAHENLMFSTCCAMSTNVCHILADEPDCIEICHISSVERDKGPDYPATCEIMNEIFDIEPAIGDVEKFRSICETVSKRAGYLVGVCLSALLNKMGYENVVVALGGSIFKCHPRFTVYMESAMDCFVEKNIQYELTMSENDSGRGAAAVAAILSANGKKEEKDAATKTEKDEPTKTDKDEVKKTDKDEAKTAEKQKDEPKTAVEQKDNVKRSGSL